MSLVRDFIEAMAPSHAYAEEAEEEEEAVEDVKEGDAEEEEEEDEDDDDDEDEDEAVDPLDALKEDVKEFQACTERVTKAEEDPEYANKDYKEDCVEEFFHLQQCVNKCAAPKLFSHLK
ncbi:hypothetical protein HII13_000644 [Brettanomyces bruxellensis]|nr:hypothetical protein HII13_000644 [Brettanomyces bruxellensis]